MYTCVTGRLHDGAGHSSSRLFLIGSELRQFVEHSFRHVVIIVAILGSCASVPSDRSMSESYLLKSKLLSFHAYVIVLSPVPLFSPEQESGQDVIGLRNTQYLIVFIGTQPFIGV